MAFTFTFKPPYCVSLCDTPTPTHSRTCNCHSPARSRFRSPLYDRSNLATPPTDWMGCLQYVQGVWCCSSSPHNLSCELVYFVCSSAQISPSVTFTYSSPYSLSLATARAPRPLAHVHSTSTPHSHPQPPLPQAASTSTTTFTSSLSHSPHLPTHPPFMQRMPTLGGYVTETAL
jgi:hypothetical protein